MKPFEKMALKKAEGNISVDDLVSLAKVVLENNFFEFDENVSQQNLGTAIGTKFAPGFLWGILRSNFWILVS